jgi:hypothetical protein
MMQQLILNLDQRLENALNLIAQQEGKNISDVIINAIACFVKQKSSLSVKKLDPFCHSTPIQYPVTEELNDVKPFAQVKNSAQFGKALREKVWHRAHHYE